MKKILTAFISLLIFSLMLLNAQIVTAGAKNGISLWFSGLLPSLLPYMIISNLVIYYKIASDCAVIMRPLCRILKINKSASYTILSGLFFGYPSCAIVADAMYKKGDIDKNTANFCICAFNNISPAFIMGYFCVGVLGDIYYAFKIIPLFYIITLLSTIIIRTLLFKNLKMDTPATNVDLSVQDNLFDLAVTSSVKNILKLLGYVVIFSVANAFVMDYLDENFRFVCGIVEITGGISLINEKSLLLAMPMLSFGGICGIFQTIGVCHKGFLDTKKYISGKLLTALISLLITVIARYVLKIL